MFGKKAFLVVFLLDASKGVLAVSMASWLDGRPAVLLMALAAVMLGHCYPIVHRFRGGKGAAAFIGGLLVFNVTWIVPILISYAVLYPILKKFTAASVVATLSLIPCCFWIYDVLATIIITVIVGLLLWTHRADLMCQKEGIE